MGNNYGSDADLSDMRITMAVKTLSPLRYQFVHHILAGLDPIEATRRAGYSGDLRKKAGQLSSEPAILETLAAMAPDRFGHLRGTGHASRRPPSKLMTGASGILKSPGRVRAMNRARQIMLDRRAAAGLPVPASYWTSI